MIVLFQRLLKQAIDITSADWNRLSVLLDGYSWLKKNTEVQLWSQIEYKLQPEHFAGLSRFFDDMADMGLIEEAPSLTCSSPIDRSVKPGAVPADFSS